MSKTVRAAAENSSKQPSARERVLRYIRSCRVHGATDEQITQALNMDGGTQRPRRRELEMAGLVATNGRYRETSTGRMAMVWEAV